MRAVIALGGNALLRAGQRGTFREQRDAVAYAAAALGRLAAGGLDLVVTHGNGPQVGRILLQNLAAARRTPPMPLDVLGAESQAEIGYLLQQTLGEALAPRPVATVLTQTVVDEHDPAFARPSKPIGPYMLGPAARALEATGIPVQRDEIRGGWRRVVASPSPIRFVEERIIAEMADAGFVPICAGGGGVPVVPDGDGYRGVEAVIDKDLAAAVLLKTVAAGLLVIVTDVEHVLLDRGTERERSVGTMRVAEARQRAGEGQFPSGSMGPKVQAAIEAVEAGARAIITSLEAAPDALEGAAGTEITP